MDFTAFLFGNVNEEGELEDENLLGKNEVAQLGRLGVVGDVMEEMKEARDDDEEEEEEESSVSQLARGSSIGAEDYADINELAEDDNDTIASSSDSKEHHYMIGAKYIQSGQSALSRVTEQDNDDDYDEEGEEGEKHDSNSLNEMEVQVITDSSVDMTNQSTNLLTDAPPQPPSLPPIIQEPSQESGTPTASVNEQELSPLVPEGITREELLEKVMKLFPTFKPDSILRFSTLISPKRSSLPNVWKDCKKPQRKRKEVGQGAESRGVTLVYGPIPDREMWDDQEQRFLTPVNTAGTGAEGGGVGNGGGVVVDSEIAEWREGPAKMWYDMINVPKDGRGFDYGFKLKSTSSSTTVASRSEDEGVTCEETLPDDAFLMVTQLPWENDILYYVPPATGPPKTAQGGIWTTVDVKQGASNSTAMGGTDSAVDLPVSMFPIENNELIYGRWEDDIIYDSEAVSHIPKPCINRLDPNDPNILLGIPDEPVQSTEPTKENKKDFKKPSKSWNKQQNKNETAPTLGFSKKDPFNLSNDEFYNPRHASSTHGLPGIDSNNVVQHSTPALDLYIPWFPTHWSAHALRYFHRPRLKIKVPIGESSTGLQSLSNLKKNITKKDKEREKERIMSGGGEVFFMRSPEDLSSCDSHLLLAEYSEEHPPLVMATGMAVKVKNYYRRPEKVKSGPPTFTYGETTYLQNSSYFLGSLKPGQSLQSFECNLFRAPLYLHTVPETDFLVVRSDNSYYIREVGDLFVVGQECPKVEVPAPNSKTVNQFQKDFLQVYLYRLFQESDDNPKKIKMEMVRKAFPPSVMSESVIRKVLKQFADFRREGYESGSWVLRSDVRLPTEEEIRAMVTPEQACAFFSMLAAEQRLKDAGYGGKSLFAVEDDEDGEDSSQKIDDEVRAAPWNTTHHFINAMKGKYQLSVSGPADPTGCGEGFSYTRLNPKDAGNPSISPSKRPKTVMGTDADLRKLKLNKARAVLRNFGVPEEEISKLSRWKVIDLVRSISTEAARSGGAVDVSSLMFARGTRFSQMEAQEKYRDQCQRVFDLQNKVLASAEVLSTDEESSDSDSDDELGRNLESLLSSKKTAIDLTHEQEEMERQELRRY